VAEPAVMSIRSAQRLRRYAEPRQSFWAPILSRFATNGAQIQRVLYSAAGKEQPLAMLTNPITDRHCRPLSSHQLTLHVTRGETVEGDIGACGHAPRAMNAAAVGSATSWVIVAAAKAAAGSAPATSSR
jgi:hypothetical protein